MNISKYSKLETDIKFKSRFVPISIWKKNFIYILSPIILLLFSIFSIIYIFEAGRLASLMTIPYLLIFFVAVVFLRLAKNYVMKKEVTQEGKYLVCLAKIIKEDEKNMYLIFTNGEKRHDKYFIEKCFKQLDSSSFPELSLKDVPYSIKLPEIGEPLFLKVFRRKSVIEKNLHKDINEILHLEYIDNKHIRLISSKTMAVFS